MHWKTTEKKVCREKRKLHVIENNKGNTSTVIFIGFFKGVMLLSKK